MSWDRKKRGGGRGYYYRSVRIGGRAVKQYVGSGKKAEEAARLVEERRGARQVARAAEARLACVDVIHDELAVWVRLLVRAHLIVGGMYEHHGGWRRRGRRLAKAT
jgi:hypothetical protein